jgi:hypothetical protein
MAGRFEFIGHQGAHKAMKTIDSRVIKWRFYRYGSLIHNGP